MSENELPSDELARALLERLQADSVDCTDPYDLYVNRIKYNVFADPSSISNRIGHGYRVIIEDIASAN